MSTWTPQELEHLATASELLIATYRPGGSPRAEVPIWVVRVQDRIFVRSWRGRGGGWFRQAITAGAAHVRAGTFSRKVTVTGLSLAQDVDQQGLDQQGLDQAIDAAYRTKYASAGAAYVGPMTGAEATAATLELLPSLTSTVSGRNL